ncbi:MAG TPA: hypothetical protein VGC27_05425 [Rhizomicrobium sp.]
MRTSDGTNSGSRIRRLVRADIFQMCIGLVLAVFLVQSDRAISSFGAAGAPPALISKDAIVAGAHMVHLECVRLVTAFNNVVRVTKSGSTPCHFIAIFE